MKINGQYFYLEKICKNGEIQEYLFPWMCNSRVANFTYFQSVKPMILVKYLLDNYFRPRIKNSHIYVNLAECSNSRSNVFNERLFVFFITLFLRRWMLNSSKPHCHPRLPKLNLKILLINWNILEKQLPQAASCCNHGRQIAS